MRVAVTGLGLRCALGSEPEAVVAALARGVSGLVEHPPLVHLGQAAAGVVQDVGLGTWLQRRKDRKLMARPAQLVLPALGEALGDWPGDRVDLGLFLAVGREPPDDGSSEEALAASAREGLLDEVLLSGPGRDRYPPLLPLRTLPNMALAHASINLGIGGENGAWAGDAEAGAEALRAGFWAVVEGRAPAVLVGGADSLVDLGSARDRLRRGRLGAPGEAGAALLLEPEDTQRPVLAWLQLEPSGPPALALEGPLGDCGAATLVVQAVLSAVSQSRQVPVGGVPWWVGDHRGVAVVPCGAC